MPPRRLEERAVDDVNTEGKRVPGSRTYHAQVEDEIKRREKSRYQAGLDGNFVDERSTVGIGG